MTPPVPYPSPDLAWIDVETTGLDEHTGALLEVGVVLTTWALEQQARAAWVLHFAGPVDGYIAAMHGPTGSDLLAAALASPLTREGASREIVAWLRARGVGGARYDEDGVLVTRGPGLQIQTVKPLLANNSAHFDRRWLRAHLPAVEALLSHQTLDLTSLDKAFAHWAGADQRRDDERPHRALPDLDLALDRARVYRGQFARLRVGP